MLYPPLSSCLSKREKEKIWSLPLAAMKGQPRIATHIGQASGISNKRNASAILLCVSFEQAMVIDSNAVDESRVPTPNTNRVHPAPIVEASNSFAVLSPEDSDGEPMRRATFNVNGLAGSEAAVHKA